MSLAFLSSVYKNTNQTGASRLYGVSRSSRYNRASKSTLNSAGFSNNISSARVNDSTRADGHLILFGSPFSFISFPNYDGLFAQITNRKNSGIDFDVDQLSAHGFNNTTTNLLLVAANKGGFEVRLSFRDMFLQKWKDEIDPLLGGDASRKGNPTLTWTMFPQGISYLNSSRRYLKIHQKLNINVPWWPDYDATITYHLYLYLSGSGRLRGHVARWAYWVEGGIKSGQIADKLEPKVISGMGKLNDRFSDELDSFSSISFKDLYYLPGRQTTPKPTGVFTGWTTDDVTIVAEL